MQLFNKISGLLQNLSAGDIIRTCILILFGFFLAKLLSTGSVKIIKNVTSNYQALLVQKIIFYSIFSLFVIAGLQDLGFHLSFLLGAAGILTVAIGFAAQTSASNIISGLFLVAEAPFFIGDVILVNDINGKIIGIDLLSVKILNFDNTIVRIPNETMIKSNIVNQTRSGKRRCDLQLLLDYHNDIERVKRILFALANENTLALKDPAPSIMILDFTPLGVKLQFSAWTNQGNYGAVRTQLTEAITKIYAEQRVIQPKSYFPMHAET